MRKALLVILAAVVVFSTVLTACNSGDPSAPSTAPTYGMDFSFDKNDIDGSYDESDVISVIQGDPVVVPSDDESSESSAPTQDSTEDVSSDESTAAPTPDSSVAVPDDSSVATPNDSSAIVPEDSSIATPNDSSTTVPEDSSIAPPNDSSVATPNDSSVSVPNDSSVATPDDSSVAIPDDSSSTAPNTSSSVAPDESSSTAPAPAPTGDVYITTAGTHVLTGGFTDRKVIVEIGEKEDVQIVLDNVVINNSKGPAIFVKAGDKVTLTAKVGTTNTISDGTSYVYTDGTTTVDSAIFSLADLTINGTGKLTINGNYKHGVVSKDNLIIAACTLNVTSKSTALNGKDCVKITSGTFKINAGTNGIVSDNAESTTRGYVYIEGGTLDVVSAYDGIQAQTILKADNANVTVKAGGGSVNMLNNAAESFKAFKAVSDILISGGTYKLDSRDDCLHSNNTVNITGGTITLSSGDDAIHADTDLAISGGTVSITKSYEGVEATRVLVSDGKLSVVSSDDGINAVGTSGEIRISGGYTFISSGGDGIDSNGTVTISGGVTLVSGPTGGGNGMFDFDGNATVTGGTLVALGPSDMAQNFTTAQNQGAILCSFSSQTANTSFAVCDSDGNVVVSFTTPKSYKCAVVTCAGIQNGNTYTLVAGATVAGADANGYAENTTKTGGTTLATVTMTSNLYGSGGGMGGGRPR